MAVNTPGLAAVTSKFTGGLETPSDLTISLARPDFGFVRKLRVDLSRTDEQQRNVRTVDGDRRGAERVRQRRGGRLGGGGGQVGAVDGDQGHRARSPGFELAALTIPAELVVGPRAVMVNGEGVRRSAIAGDGDAGGAGGGDESGGDARGQLATR